MMYSFLSLICWLFFLVITPFLYQIDELKLILINSLKNKNQISTYFFNEGLEFQEFKALGKFINLL